MSERVRVTLLLAVAMLVYGNTLPNNFSLDDELYIFRNPAVTSPSAKILFEATKFNNVFRPVTFASFALNWAVGGTNPFGYHLLNLLLNAVVALLLYVVLRTLLESLAGATEIALAAALLFAVHPIHTEAVASIVGRSELLSVGFLLAAWALHLRDQHIFSLMCFVLALLSKESAVAFVPLVLAGDYARAKLKPLHRYGWIVGVAVLYLAVLWRIQGGRFGEKGINFLDNPLAGLPASLRILNALRIAWKYVGLHVYPATLSCEYSYNAILLYSNWRRTAPAVIASALVLALWIWALQTKRREWFLAGAIYLGGFAATANLLVPTGTIMGERLAYLPSAGFCLLVALIWIRLERRERRLAWAMFGIIVAALATRTVIRNRDWRDNFTLFSADVRAVPGSAKMHANLGGVYLYRDQLDAARKEFQTALSIYSDFPAAMEYYGLVESRTGHDQEALRLLVGALSMTRKDDINYDFMAVNLASHFMKLGNKDDALKILDDDIAMSPGYARAWATRAALHYARGELTLARTDAQMALSLDPSNTQAQNLLNFTKAPASPAPVP